MSPAELDAVLEQTLADRRVSPAEKAALADLLAARRGDDQFLGLARSRAFAAARAAAADPESARVLGWLEDVLKLLLPQAGPAPAAAACAFSPGEDCLRAIVGRFTAARRSADCCVFTVTDDRIAEAMTAAHRRGVAVRLLTDDDKAADLGSDVDRLRAAGIQVRTDRSPYHMHHKFGVFDGATLLTGSYNWTRGAATSNEENLVVTADPGLVRAFAAEFERLWDKFAD